MRFFLEEYDVDSLTGSLLDQFTEWMYARIELNRMPVYTKLWRWIIFVGFRLGLH